MEKPGHCSVELYHLMLCCWRLDPRKRPSFQSLMVSLEAMLLDEAEYLQLDSLIAHNMTYFNAFEYDECPTKSGNTIPADFTNYPLFQIDGDGVEYGSILHRILNDNSDEEEQAAGIAVNATLHMPKIEENERQVEYTWLWRGNKKRGWNEKTLSQSLLSETDEVDDDSSAMDYSQGNCDKEEAVNANQEETEYICPIRLPEQTQNIPHDVANLSDRAD
ncbi:hypothetical protein J437_LFUL006941 [Ladona fulva]|uniref:Serine-threonine/tyrosine-protein kinase catalytic domain-containing protein n=1 Tax=Ladona fulva TaxID=123851 RepID=A0A8K0P1D3_LADFU|nr:hypothetical protein J437_LFUL006941 [Ladona fulva]